ncbi:MAG: ABC transporter permease [Ruminococcus sp.]|nr:ABC transporter permease [Ruminococcus sp.]MCM1479001.1 ABC transporter permease [Muribaculaceae bacterium]
MYLNILKKDLKRKRAMNVILLVFIILASMFVSSSVNNIISVVSALDNYFDMAGVPDYVAGITNKSSDRDVRGTLENASAIDEFRTEEMFYMSQSNIIRDGEPLNASAGSQILQSDRDLAVNYFLDDESILENVPRGKVYATHFAEKNTGLKAGDKISIEIEGVSREFTFAGSIKDAALGAQMNGITRFIINAEDFDEYMSNETVKNMYGGQFFYIFTADLDKTLSQISDISGCFILSADRETLKFSYIFNIMVTGVILVVSLVLIIISFVVLRFTIIFTLSEEFREIGVMKAIGIRDIKIRGLYLVKYSALSVVGAAVGLALSYPFGEMLMSLSTDAIIINSDNVSFINVICAVFVAAVILLFCLGCTGRVGKMTPIDAVRNGQTGERFRKKSLMSLGKSKLGGTAFLAANDIVSSPKRYGIITFTFFLCMSLLIILSNMAASLKSAELLKYFGLADCHVLADIGDDNVPFMTEGGREKLEKYLEDMEQSLAENGMPAECMQEFMFSPVIKHGEYKSKVLTFQGTGTEMDMYEYTEGTAPQNSGEIALTTLAAKALKANIGDSVVMSDGVGEREYIVTALYQSMTNQGVAARLYTGEDINYLLSIGSNPVQIKFTDNPDDGETARRAEKIAELYPKFSNVKTAGEWVRETTGVADAINAAKEMFVLLTVILTALITVLTERSFIAKEQAEIALMKAIGLRNSKIYAHHTARFFIVTAAAVIAAELLGMPLTRLCIDPVFGMMGLEMGVEYQQTPAEIYALFPAAVFAAATAGAFLTSLYTRKIKSSDTANIE